MATRPTSKKLTIARVDDYIAGEGRLCPFCKSEDIEAPEPPIVDNAVCTQFIQCHSCQKDWTDVYRLVGLHTQQGGTVYSTENQERNPA